VTERRRAERALRASHAFLERTGRIANVGGWEVNLRSGEITFTDQLCHIHEVEPGYKPTYQQALAFYPPEARATIVAVMEAGRSDGIPWDLQLPFVTARGRPPWVRAIGEAEWQDNQPVRLIGALQDITEQHLRQAELEQEQHLRQRSEQHAQQLDALLRERDEMLDVLAHEVRQTRTRTASMDLGLMRLALRNLLSNALKYGSPDAPVTVRLSDSDNPLALLIDVIDTGQAVPDAVLGRLFERGARGHGADAPPGHGLGLFFVRRVMELHGGQVELARNGSGGVTMRLVLDQSPGE
jgi:signal transduction histidine kinase